MKKIIITLLISVIFVSCTKEIVVENNKNVGTLEASIESPAPDTKTALGNEADGKVPFLWTIEPSPDAINIYSFQKSTKFLYTLKEINGTSGVFQGDALPPSSKGYNAFYPAKFQQSVYSWNSFKFPAEQTYVKENIGSNLMPMFAYKFAKNDNISFKNLFGILRLQFNGTATVKKIVVSTNQKGKTLNGTATLLIKTYPSLTISAETKYKYNATTKDQMITLNCGDVNLSTDETTEFNIVLPPYKSYGSDLSIKVYKSETEYEELVLRKDVLANQIKANIITRMPVKTINK